MPGKEQEAFLFKKAIKFNYFCSVANLILRVLAIQVSDSQNALASIFCLW